MQRALIAATALLVVAACIALVGSSVWIESLSLSIYAEPSPATYSSPLTVSAVFSDSEDYVCLLTVLAESSTMFYTSKCILLPKPTTPPPPTSSTSPGITPLQLGEATLGTVLTVSVTVPITVIASGYEINGTGSASSTLYIPVVYAITETVTVTRTSTIYITRTLTKTTTTTTVVDGVTKTITTVVTETTVETSVKTFVTSTVTTSTTTTSHTTSLSQLVNLFIEFVKKHLWLVITILVILLLVRLVLGEAHRVEIQY